jgi:GNAT superfamily N-acetyltransferase
MSRAATSDDLPAIAELYHRVWHETHARFMPVSVQQERTLEFFAHRIGSWLPTTLVHESSGLAVGFASWHHDLLAALYVAHSHRGSGVAGQLLAGVEYRMSLGGVTDAWLNCVVGNHRARCFYERLGWCHTGEVMDPVPFWRLTKRLGG